jgi:beta-galactosidase
LRPSPDKLRSSDGDRGVRLVLGAIAIAGETVPLYAGAVHYWRLDPRDWRACLLAVKELGLRLVDTYIPWSVHEIAPGKLELGEHDPQRDVAAFIRLAAEIGLWVIARPGPHINAELTHFGIPERVVWDPACQARSPAGHPVMLPMLPVAFPVPSYASEAFFDEVARYFHALAPVLAPLRYPDGPIVLFQIDNEGALYFRDGAYDQDYHPDAIALYRSFLRDKYHSIEALQAAYGSSPAPPDGTAAGGHTAEGDQEGEPAGPRVPEKSGAAPEEELRFASIKPPVAFDAQAPAGLARHMDWSEFHEHLLATALDRFARSLAAAGLSGIPTSHNLPPGHDGTPLNAARVTRAVDLVGFDYYHAATAQSRSIIARRTSELAVRSEGWGVPAFACEMGAGFPPFFPPLDERDSAFTVLAGLAYGLRGFNVYMAVERDRWIGSPIDHHGRPRPFAGFWRKLTSALEATAFHSLRRRVPVRILIPRSERRLARVMHAFGPLTGAFFSIIGAGARESCFEDDLGLGHPLAIEADSFARAFEAALEARGVPFAHVGGEDRDVSLVGAAWIICATSGGMNPELWKRLEQAAQAGTRVTLGPRAPVFDGAFRALAHPFDLARLQAAPPEGAHCAGQGAGASRPHPHLAALVEDVPAAAAAAVSRAIEDLSLPAHACIPDSVFATVHEDAAGRPRVLFVLNPAENDVVVRVTVGPAITHATDALDESAYEAQNGVLEVRMKPRTVRMITVH